MNQITGSRLLKALCDQHWAMDKVIFEQMKLIVLRHAHGERLEDEEINTIVAARGDGDMRGNMLVEDGVAIIPIEGVITKGSKSVDRISQPRGTATGEIQTNISNAIMMPDVRSIVLNIDSPGGSVKGIEETANAIFNARKKKPIVMYANDMAASAAYWLGSQANFAMGNLTGAVGSIGVYMAMVDSSKAAEKAGYAVYVISTGPHKGAGVPGSPLTAEQQAAFQVEVDDILDVFVKQIVRGRGISRDRVREAADGRMWMGKEAVRMGLIDKVGSLADAVVEARRLGAGGKGRKAASADESLRGDDESEVTNAIDVIDDLIELTSPNEVIAGSGETENGSHYTYTITKNTVAGDNPQQNEKESDMDTPADPQGTTAAAIAEKAAKAAAAAEEEALKKASATVADKEAVEKAALAAKASEKQRHLEIRSIGEKLGLEAKWADAHCAGETTIEQARKDAIDELAKKQPNTVTVGEDLNKSTIAQAMEDALMVRAGIQPEEAHPRHKEFLGRSIVENARLFLETHGVSCLGMSRPKICQETFRQSLRPSPHAAGAGGYGNYTGDYPKILENIISKRLRMGYDENFGTWKTPGLMTTGTLPDFKEASMVALGAAADLSAVSEGGTYTEMTVPETREKFTLVKYGKLYSLTWEMMINDDVNAFARIPFLMGAAAARLENVTAWFPITNTQFGSTMDDDSVAIFNSAHRNYDTAAGSFGAATLTALKLLMRKQYAPQDADGDSAKLNLIPKFLCGPPELENAILTELHSTAATADNKSSGVANIHHKSLTPVIEPLLSGVPTSGLIGTYLFADTSQIDTIHVAFLEGEQSPVMEQEQSFSSDGRRYKIRHTIVSKAIDFRGMAYADGT